MQGNVICAVAHTTLAKRLRRDLTSSPLAYPPPRRGSGGGQGVPAAAIAEEEADDDINVSIEPTGHGMTGQAAAHVED